MVALCSLCHVACIYLQHSSKKDRSLAELKTLSCNLESQLGEARERAEIAEKEMGELKMEVQDIEGVLANRQVEMTSLHEQLTEVGCSPVNEVPFHVYFNQCRFTKLPFDCRGCKCSYLGEVVGLLAGNPGALQSCYVSKLTL